MTANNANPFDAFDSQIDTGVGNDQISISNVTINGPAFLVSDTDQGGTGLSGSDTIAVANTRIDGETLTDTTQFPTKGDEETLAALQRFEPTAWWKWTDGEWANSDTPPDYDG